MMVIYYQKQNLLFRLTIIFNDVILTIIFYQTSLVL